MQAGPDGLDHCIVDQVTIAEPELVMVVREVPNDSLAPQLRLGQAGPPRDRWRWRQTDGS